MKGNIVNIQSFFTGFRPIRRDRLLQEQVHDAYKSKGKLPEPTVCPQCSAVYHEGRWRWLEIPAKAHQEMCPACHRMNDHYPAGFITLEGPYFLAHSDEIMRLVHNHEQYERVEHPLKRIMAIEKHQDSMVVTTTDIHLARDIGEAVQRAYQGRLEFHYNPEENLLRVYWKH